MRQRRLWIPHPTDGARLRGRRSLPQALEDFLYRRRPRIPRHTNGPIVPPNVDVREAAITAVKGLKQRTPHSGPTRLRQDSCRRTNHRGSRRKPDRGLVSPPTAMRRSASSCGQSARPPTLAASDLKERSAARKTGSSSSRRSPF